jgi:archaellum biogenesis protein FlaJ (TadC family)
LLLLHSLKKACSFWMLSIASSLIRAALLHVSHSNKTTVIFEHKNCTEVFINNSYTCFERHVSLCSSFGDLQQTHVESFTWLTLSLCIVSIISSTAASFILCAPICFVMLGDFASVWLCFNMIFCNSTCNNQSF